MKNFNNFIKENKMYSNIKTKTNTYLSYIIDDGFNVSFSDGMRYIEVYIGGLGIENSWIDCKYDIIQYLKYMSEYYYIEFIEITINNRSVFIEMKEMVEMDEFDFNKIKIAFKKVGKKK